MPSSTRPIHRCSGAAAWTVPFIAPAGPRILEECERIVARIGRLPAGQAVATGGGRLEARHVIHTVGPFWSGGNRNEAETLASCHHESVRALADELKLESLVFPGDFNRRVSTILWSRPRTSP